MRTFVVRLWTAPRGLDGEPDELDGLRGVVEQLGTRRSEAFRDEDELLAFLHGRPVERELELGRGDGGAP
jgi:hypothetical protein